MLKNMLENFKRYQFLMGQMIARDFKVKYKRSVLGIFWSVLSPILMSAVMYLVFGKMFGNGDPTFIIYLMVGQILFSYFSEASNFGMMSIVGNFTLITKIYIPKYIFPLSKCLFSGINLLVSFLPLLFIVVFLQRPITVYYFLIPVILLCLFLFTVGVSLIMATISVFLRDMYHLYGILLMVWQYMTPMFWTMDRIPESYQFYFKLNPLYHYITSVRGIMIDGIAPSTQSLLYGFVFGLVALLIGLFVFKKNQDKFIYYV